MKSRRIHQEPSYVLHSYPFSESSLVLELWTRHHGRVVVLAKGVKKPTSSFRSVILPLQLLRLGFSLAQSEGAEIGLLKSADWGDAHVMPSGQGLLGGMYVNELLLRLLAREDPHPTLFDIYHGVVQALAGGEYDPSPSEPNRQAALLRAFEILLLRELGWLPALHWDVLGQTDVRAEADYVLDPQLGIRPAQLRESALGGVLWQALHAAAALPGHAAALPSLASILLSISAQDCRTLHHQLLYWLQQHSGIGPLRSKQFAQALRSIQSA